MVGKVRAKAVDKKKGGGGATDGSPMKDDVMDHEVHKAIQRELSLLKKQLTLEPIHDNTEKQVRLVIAILRMNISALRGTIIHDSAPDVAAERKAAVDRLVTVTDEFDKKKHTPDSINEDARVALNELSDTFRVFGPSWITIRDSIVALALEQIEDIKSKEDPLQKEKERLKEMEKVAKKLEERDMKAHKEQKDRVKAEKERKKKNKKKKKNNGTHDDAYDDFGDDRVPPQTSCENHTCRCQHNHEPSPAIHKLIDLPPLHRMNDNYDVGSDSDDVSQLAEETALEGTEEREESQTEAPPHSPHSPSSTASTFSCDDQPVLSHVMSVEYWSQFCYFYDQGSK